MEPRCDAGSLANDVRTTLQEIGFDPRETVLHVHNHSLGKNASLPAALCLLAEDGYALLLQIHDFAEDYRPENYARLAVGLRSQGGCGKDGLAGYLYPQASRIHYATLNQRDCDILRQAGVLVERLHRLPNMVEDHGSSEGRGEARRRLAASVGVPSTGGFVLYPVRGIRRKNLAEALLWSALAGEDVHFGFTLPPLNPAERPRYEHWKRLARRFGLRCHFELVPPRTSRSPTL